MDAPSSIEALRDRWGAAYFASSPPEVVESLPLLPHDKMALCTVGLPIGPPKALHLALRFENVDIHHQPDKLRLLTKEANFEVGPHFPKTGFERIDDRIDLTKSVVIGEVPNEFEGNFFLSRYVCLDGGSGAIYWIYPSLIDGRTHNSWFNTSLATYLGCLLAYKGFREEWRDLLAEFEDADQALRDDGYQRRAETIHSEFTSRLKGIDSAAYENGFWGVHAGNETRGSFKTWSG